MCLSGFQLFPMLSVHVSLQVCLLVEALVTVVAGEGLLAGVGQ